jgi:hypothetical protein
MGAFPRMASQTGASLPPAELSSFLDWGSKKQSQPDDLAFYFIRLWLSKKRTQGVHCLAAEFADAQTGRRMPLLSYRREQVQGFATSLSGKR